MFTKITKIYCIASYDSLNEVMNFSSKFINKNKLLFYILRWIIKSIFS